jgi:hypothetical protein
MPVGGLEPAKDLVQLEFREQAYWGRAAVRTLLSAGESQGNAFQRRCERRNSIRASLHSLMIACVSARTFSLSRLRGCEVARLRGCELARLRGCEDSVAMTDPLSKVLSAVWQQIARR